MNFNGMKERKQLVYIARQKFEKFTCFLGHILHTLFHTYTYTGGRKVKVTKI